HDEHRLAARRADHRRERLLVPGRRAAAPDRDHGARHAAAPGDRAARRRGVRLQQPLRRPRLRVVEPADQVRLMATRTTVPTTPQSSVVDGLRRRGRSLARGLRRELAYAWATPSGRIGLPLVTLHLVLALAGPLLAPFPASEFHLEDRFSGPTATYWL